MRIENLSRRGFIKGAAVVSGLVLELKLDPAWRLRSAYAAAPQNLSPSVYVTIAESGIVTITAHRSEMGTGIRTGLPMVLADELDADWRKVRIVQAQGDAKYGDQNTDGSRSVRHFYQPMREAGATARQMLETAAARTWHVSADECRARNHEVVHLPTKRRLPFGGLVRVATGLPVPARDRLRFKEPAERRYVGHPVPIVDLQDMIRGTAKYGIDIRLPGMKHASIERCPVYGGKVKSYDATEARAIPGVEQIIEIDPAPMPAGFHPLGGLAVIATNSWAAQQARERLKIEWDYGPNAAYDSVDYRRELEESARHAGHVARNEGDTAAALATAAQRVTAEYYVPHYAHAPMEPPAAVAHVAGNRCELWASTQDPQTAKHIAAQAIGMDDNAVTINVTLLGGGFGRKSKPDFIVEAAVLSQKLSAPVKVTWTREDEIRNGYYHAVSAQHLEGGLDAQGRAVGWLHRTAFPSIASTFQPNVTYGNAGELGQGVVDMPYAIPNVRCENGPAKAHVRIGWFRSVYNIPHAFAVCSFADELAVAAGRDPLAYLRDLLGTARRIDLKSIGVDYPNYGDPIDLYPIDTGRMRAVLDRAAAEAGWGGELPPRHGRGIALHRSFNSIVAVVVQVAVAENGDIAIPRIDMAIDCGVVVNPDRVRAQLEGAAIFGLSAALYSNITMKEGKVEQSNLSDYLLARIDITPETHVHMVEGDGVPGGVGEPGVPPVAPALCNAIFAATRQRIRALPIDTSQLKQA
jgi:isoquinoline 1-oxidoreductase beta subunit